MPSKALWLPVGGLYRLGLACPMAGARGAYRGSYSPRSKLVSILLDKRPHFMIPYVHKEFLKLRHLPPRPAARQMKTLSVTYGDSDV
jgi:hypothetical protein